MSAHPGYRPEIDGLRAIAVLSVLVFHFDPAWLPGGFTGVDIFLVISGYLITRQIADLHLRGIFSFRDFYLRRIRRIAPAYFAVVVASLATACVLMLPVDLAHTARAATWSAFSLPNVFFWLHLDTGYFAQDARQEVFLHLWSLGVEEQFYLLWPALLLLLLRLKGAIALALLTAASLASITLAQWVSGWDPAFSYYMLPTRAGELGIGALLALASPAPAPHSERRHAGPGHELAALAGLGLIAAGFFVLDHDSTFPGFNVLYPCLGAALVIHADSRGRCAVLAPLRSRPVVAIGLLSYSLYLWHWPVLAFVRYAGLSVNVGTAALLVPLIFTLAGLCYWLVERPARRVGWQPRTQLAALFVLPLCLVLIASAWIRAGANDTADTHAESLLLARTAPAYEFQDNCQLAEFDPHVLERPQCVHGALPPTGKPDLLWGDSHAAHYIGIVGSLSEARGRTTRNASFSTCPPVWSDSERYGSGIYRSGCTPFRALIESNIDDYATIYLGAQWSIHLRRASFTHDFEQTLRALAGRGHEVVLLAEVPGFPGFDRNCEIRNLHTGLVNCRELAEQQVHRHEGSLAWLHALAADRPLVSVLDISPILCPQQTCSPWLDGQPVYFDQTHLSMPGSWEIGRIVTRSRDW